MDHEKRVIPIVERLEFPNWQEKGGEAQLTIHSGERKMLCVQDGCYICQYRAKGAPRMNAFVKTIDMLIVHKGIWYAKSEGTATYDSIIQFVTNCKREKFEIREDRVKKFLLSKPQIVISREGVIALYTKSKIMMTVNGLEYAEIDIQGIQKAIGKEICVIQEITVGGEKTLISLERTNSTERITKIMDWKMDLLEEGIVTGVNFI